MDVLDAGCMDRSSCDWLLNDLGPPPDAILRIPPPPVPHFIDSNYVVAAGIALADDSADNDTLCHWCHWARLVDSSSMTGSAGTGNQTIETWFRWIPLLVTVSHQSSRLVGCWEAHWLLMILTLFFGLQKWRWKIRGSSSFWRRVWCLRSAPYSPDSFIYDFTGKLITAGLRSAFVLFALCVDRHSSTGRVYARHRWLRSICRCLSAVVDFWRCSTPRILASLFKRVVYRLVQENVERSLGFRQLSIGQRFDADERDERR